MREKQLRLIVTFNTTTGVMAMEKACKSENIPGRLIPVPRQISAGCGLSWLCNKEDREKIESYCKSLELHDFIYYFSKSREKELQKEK